jgi:hypothetical protein
LRHVLAWRESGFLGLCGGLLLCSISDLRMRLSFAYSSTPSPVWWISGIVEHDLPSPREQPPDPGPHQHPHPLPPQSKMHASAARPSVRTAVRSLPSALGGFAPWLPACSSSSSSSSSSASASRRRLVTAAFAAPPSLLPREAKNRQTEALRGKFHRAILKLVRNISENLWTNGTKCLP